MKLKLKLPGAGGLKRKGLSGRKVLRKLQRIVGYIALFVFVFLFAAWVSLPTDAIAWRIGHEARKAGYAIDVGDVSISPFGGATLREVTWIYEPSRPGQIPENFYLEEVDVDVSILSLLIGTVSIEIDTSIDDATIHAFYSSSSSESSIQLEVSDLPLYEVPKLRQAVNAPMRGLFGLKVDLVMKENKWVNAEGTIELACNECAVGDGETLMYLPGVNRGMMAEGITLPEIEFGSLAGTLRVAKGVAFTEGIETSSKDLEAKLSGGMTLGDPFSKSRVDLQFKFFLTETLREKSEKLNLVVQTADKKARLEGDEEGWLAYSLYGSIRRPRFMPHAAKSAVDKRREKREAEKQKQADKAKKKRQKEAKKKNAKKPAAKKPEVKDDKKDTMDRNGVTASADDPKDEDQNEREDPGVDRPALPPPEADEHGEEQQEEPENAGGEGEGEGGGEGEGEGQGEEQPGEGEGDTGAADTGTDETGAESDDPPRGD